MKLFAEIKLRARGGEHRTCVPPTNEATTNKEGNKKATKNKKEKKEEKKEKKGLNLEKGF